MAKVSFDVTHTPGPKDLADLNATALELELAAAKARVRVLTAKVRKEAKQRAKGPPRTHTRYILILDALRMLPSGMKIAEIAALLGIGYGVAANLMRDCVARNLVWQPYRGHYRARVEAIRLLMVERAARDPVGHKLDEGWLKAPPVGAPLSVRENRELRALLEAMSNQSLLEPASLPNLPSFLQPFPTFKK